jgi:hypothetical protein
MLPRCCADLVASTAHKQQAGLPWSNLTALQPCTTLSSRRVQWRATWCPLPLLVATVGGARHECCRQCCDVVLGRDSSTARAAGAAVLEGLHLALSAVVLAVCVPAAAGPVWCSQYWADPPSSRSSLPARGRWQQQRTDPPEAAARGSWAAASCPAAA